MAGRRCPSGGLAATEQSHWKVLDVGGPLGQLEELDVAHSTPSMDTGGDREGVGCPAAGEGRALPATPPPTPTPTLLSAWSAAA